MTQENQQQDPIEEAGGYGTPTAEQEMPGGQSAAQPREEEAFDAAGLSQDSPDGETFPAGAPDLSQFGAEDSDSAGEPGAGSMGGTDEPANAEDAIAEPGFDGVDAGGSGDSGSEDGGPDVAVPSADAEMNASNTEDLDAD